LAVKIFRTKDKQSYLATLDFRGDISQSDNKQLLDDNAISAADIAFIMSSSQAIVN